MLCGCFFISYLLCGCIKKYRSYERYRFLVRMSGLEPMTPCMSSRYSNQLSYTLTTKTIISYNFLFVNP